MRFIMCTNCSSGFSGEADMGQLGLQGEWLSTNFRAGGLCLSYAEQL